MLKMAPLRASLRKIGDLARREPAPQPEEERPVRGGRGMITGADLGDVRPLMRPFEPDPFGALRPPLSLDAMKLSLELASTAYTLELENWVDAGWRDVSIQIDNHLESGVTVGESRSGEAMRAAVREWKLMRARLALREPNPVEKVRSTIRQREKSDTIKAVTLLHPAQGGRYVVAIGFMGTGSRYYDWISNFRFTTEAGFHKGFHQLASCFEESAERISFPETAAELGLERLTLADVLTEMKLSGSRFSLWMAGHSQGGAVMQVFCHKLISDWGVRPENMVGYGFASPTVSTGVPSPSAYPLYHIINTDDKVPCMGALEHLGLCLQYQANDAMRRAAYGWSDEPEDVALREQVRAHTHHMSNTMEIMETMVALSYAVLEEKGEENLSALMDKKWSIAPIDWALTFAGEKAKTAAEAVARYAQLGYRSITGRKMDMAVVRTLTDMMRPVVKELPLRRLMAIVKELFWPPHSITRGPHRLLGAYSYIVTRGSALLRPFCWENQPDGLPCRRYADGVRWAEPLPARHALPARAALRRRPAPRREPARRSARRQGIRALRGRRALPRR
ncbi:MAG: hypothetical protein PHY12_06535 [Eubacteriales bacterium]|nr:hypothetical protein [Eubacteriales bacterium]